MKCLILFNLIIIISVFFTTIICINNTKDFVSNVQKLAQQLMHDDDISQKLLGAGTGRTYRDLSDNTVCKSCEIVTENVINYRRTGASKEALLKYVVKLCMTLSDWGYKSCNGYALIEIDTILFIIDNKRNLTPQRVCSIILQHNKCHDPDAINWTIPLPPAPHALSHKPVHVADKLTNLRILQLTDIHYDPEYQPGSNSNCGEQLCCQTGHPKEFKDQAGFWGDYNVCDMPWHTVENLAKHIKEKFKHFDYLYYTGDIISHKSWATTIKNNKESIKKVYQLFREYYPRVKVFPILGNHEPHPTNFFSPFNVSNDLSTSWIFKLAASEWTTWLPEDTKSTILYGGYYTVLVRPGFRIIALNSNVCFTSNLWLIYKDEDPFDQLNWLVNVLKQAEKNREKVHILSHIPPGEEQCHRQWALQFSRIVKRFSATISAQFNGHTHLDEFRVFYDDTNKNVVNLAFNGGSFTTFVGFNPNFRFYDVNTKNYMVNDYDQYSFNLTKANEMYRRNNTSRPEWIRLYSFQEAYEVKDMTNYTQCDILLNRMKTEKNLMKKYYNYMVRNSDVKLAKGCDENCRRKLLCTIKAVDTDSVISCSKSNQ